MSDELEMAENSHCKPLENSVLIPMADLQLAIDLLTLRRDRYEVVLGVITQERRSLLNDIGRYDRLIDRLLDLKLKS